MNRKIKDTSCHEAAMQPKFLLRNADLGPSELILLTIARRYFLSYVNPVQLHWEAAIDCALEQYGHERGPSIAVAMLNVIRAMRDSRKTVFSFTNPHCQQCTTNISDGERLLFQAIKLVRNGELAPARIELLILCEGNDTEPILHAIDALVALTDRPQLVQ